MNQETLRTKLHNGQNVYIFDEYEDAVIKLVPTDAYTKVFIKRANGKEKEMPGSNETIADIMLNGEEIEESFYYDF